MLKSTNIKELMFNLFYSAHKSSSAQTDILVAFLVKFALDEHTCRGKEWKEKSALRKFTFSNIIYEFVLMMNM